MKRFALALVALAATAGLVTAGPFRRRSVAVCEGNSCQSSTQVTTTTTTTTTSTAQGVANLIVVTGRFRHWGGNTSYEGIGMGATQAQAEANCCGRSRMIPRERGFAQMSNGMWVCVCRY